MSTSREDFEAWASTGPANLERTPDGAYVSSVVAFTYRAWQARDAEVEALKAENAALRSALDFAAGAIGDAIYTEDGLDGDAGQRVLHIITEARELGTFDKASFGELDRFCPFNRAGVLEDAITAALPGVTYMDPPDGGDVPLGEQLARMAADAARWRAYRSAGGDVTLRLHYTRADGRDAAIDAQRKEQQT